MPAALPIIDTDADVAHGLAELLALDPSLVPIADAAGPLPLRRLAPGFAGLARIVVGQQLSTASAAAIWRRLEAAGGDRAAGYAALDEATLRACGLSTAKIATLGPIAAAEQAGTLDLAALATVSDADARATLTRFRGIGPWTADVFLLFCAGHADIFPAGDLALRIAVGDALEAPLRDDPRAVAAIAARWAPWRGIAARLFWAYYRARRPGRDGLPIDAATVEPG